MLIILVKAEAKNSLSIMTPCHYLLTTPTPVESRMNTFLGFSLATNEPYSLQDHIFVTLASFPLYYM